MKNGGANETTERAFDADTVIVGGGLAGGLIALARAEAGEGRGLVLLEQGVALAGNHTWSLHRSDLDEEPAAWAMLAPLIAHRWPRHELRFPGRTRTLEGDYVTITADHFGRVVEERLRAAGARVVLGRRVHALAADRVRLDDGTELRARVVFDARGPARADRATTSGYQKFVGLELDLGEDAPWDHPVLMDAGEDVAQVDGFRFLYVLPFSRRRVLVEDTMYADDPSLDADAIAARVLAYVAARGVRVRRVVRRETGVLPLPLRDATAREDDGAPLAVGYRGGFFHAVTGYSVPLAARVAVAVARAQTRAGAQAALARVRRQLGPQHRFGRLLTRILFGAMAPGARRAAFDRFYRLPAPTIARFYASRTTTWDRARVLLGRPPRGIAWRRLLGAVEARA